MQIYIASSWKNQHAVEMLTMMLREINGVKVVSFVEKATESEGKHLKGKFDINEWIESEDGYKKFKLDTNGATKSDLVIYIGPSGVDTWAEVGAAWQAGIEILGLYSKGEQSGLTRRMVTWFDSYKEIIKKVEHSSEGIME